MSYIAEHISYSISGKSLLSDVNLHIRPGEFTAVAGPNGAGKSTLLKIISGELSPDSGNVSINGTPLKKISVRDLALLRAVLPQHTSITFPFTAQEIVALGRTPHRCTYEKNMEIVQKAMRMTDTFALKEQQWHTLSGGERQRVMLARVIAQILSEQPSAPRYLLLDEPASWLDMARQQEIFSIVKGLCINQIGILAIVHDLNLAAAFSDHIFFIKEGQVVAEGSVSETFTEENIASVYECPVKIWKDPMLETPFVISGIAALSSLSSNHEHQSQETYEYISR